MKLTGQRFSIEAFKEQQSWISPLLSLLNQFFGEVIAGFSNNITVKDNLAAEIKEIKFINQAANFPIKFRTKLTQNPQGLSVIYAFDNTNSEMNFAAYPWVNWSYNNGEIRIESIQGLTAGRSYSIRLYVIYE